MVYKPEKLWSQIYTKQYGVYSNHLNTGQVWYSNGPKVSDCRMVRIWNSGLKTGQLMSVLAASVK